jgi:hypothetical protein
MQQAFAISKPTFKNARESAKTVFSQRIANPLDAEIYLRGMLRAYGLASCSVFPKKEFAGRSL